MRRCIQIADDLSDERGFVAIKSLAAHFQVSVVFRPLLVEAMLASIPASNGERPKWLVLVDSERFPSGQEAFENETADHPLVGRLRNTIAHELLHSLSFRESETDFEFRVERWLRETNEEYLKRIEGETEELSPLLLIPEKLLVQIDGGPPVSLKDLRELQTQCAVTHDVLVSRLALWKKHHSTGGSLGGGLENMGLGTGYWEGGKPWLPRFPTFVNFQNNRLPHAFKRLQTEKALCLADLFPNAEFLLNGGDLTEVELDGHRAGENLDYLKMRIRISVEEKAALRKNRFLVLVEKLGGQRR